MQTKQPRYGSEKTNRRQKEEMTLHFLNGNLQMDESTSISSNVLLCMATIYSKEPIGQIVGSDATIKYNEGQDVWVEVRNYDGSIFEWGDWEIDRKVAILFYVLTYDREYLLFCSEEDFFCYLTIPKEDPRRDRIGRIPNTHLTTTYKVLDQLLVKTNPYSFKCVPRKVEV